MATLTLVLGVAVVVSTAGLVASSLKLPSALGFLLATYLIATAEVVYVSLGLSSIRALSEQPLLASFGVGLVLGALCWLWAGRPPPPIGGIGAALREVVGDRVVAVLAALAILTHVYLLAGAVTVPQSSPDTQLYHLPRAALWRQHHAIAYVANAPDERIDATPPNAEIEIAASMILSDGDRYATLVQFLALLALCAGIAGLALRLGLTRREAAFGALAFSMFTLVTLQTPTALNDLALAAPLVACAFFTFGRSRAHLGLVALALALALGTKLTTVLALPILVLFVLVAQPRARWPGLALAGAAGLIAGSAWYGVNLVATGVLDGGLADAFPQSADRSVGPTLDRMGLFLKDFFELSGAEGQGWLWAPRLGLVVAALAGVAAGVSLLRGRPRRAASAALFALTAALVYPTLATWLDVARRASRQVLVAVGVSDAAPAARVPPQLYESSIHSGYGVAFLVLLLWVGALVAHGVVRRRLPAATIVALSAPLLFIGVFGMVIAYDPARMRFVAFPVALASAVFGLALRHRLLAWTTVALTAGTVVVSVGYFAPRPASLALLPGHHAPVRSTRWFIQAESGNGDPESFRFLEEEIPTDATIALAVVRNTYIYPAWDAGLRRTVTFVSRDGVVPSEATWLVVGPRYEVDEPRLEQAGWEQVLASEKHWRIYRR